MKKHTHKKAPKEKFEIFKLQVPLATNGEAQALIYNKNQTSRGLIPITEDVKKIMGDEFKKFIYGKRLETGVIEIHGVAPWQEW